MRKLKVYLVTSVISHLMQEDAPEKMVHILQLWEMFKNGECDVYLSTITWEEVVACPEPKRSILRDYMRQIHFMTLDTTDKVTEVVKNS